MGYRINMAELMFGLGQTKKKKETEAKVRNTKAHLKDVTITETVESNVRADQHGREKDEKALRTETKTNLRDVTITKTIETDVKRSNIRVTRSGRRLVNNKRSPTRTLTWLELFSIEDEDKYLLIRTSYRDRITCS